MTKDEASKRRERIESVRKAIIDALHEYGISIADIPNVLIGIEDQVARNTIPYKPGGEKLAKNAGDPYTLPLLLALEHLAEPRVPGAGKPPTVKRPEGKRLDIYQYLSYGRHRKETGPNVTMFYLDWLLDMRFRYTESEMWRNKEGLPEYEAFEKALDNLIEAECRKLIQDRKAAKADGKPDTGESAAR